MILFLGNDDDDNEVTPDGKVSKLSQPLLTYDSFIFLSLLLKHHHVQDSTNPCGLLRPDPQCSHVYRRSSFTRLCKTISIVVTQVYEVFSLMINEHVFEPK